MTEQKVFVASPYNISELSESDTRHETDQFIAAEGFECLGYFGDVMIDGAWHALWAFAATAEATRFAKEWGGMVVDDSVKSKVTESRINERSDK